MPPDADLSIAGRDTSSRGPDRQFVTAPLAEKGSFTGELRARWIQDGREIVRSRVITVYPGDRLTIDLRTAEEEPTLLNPPRKLPN